MATFFVVPAFASTKSSRSTIEKASISNKKDGLRHCGDRLSKMIRLLLFNNSEFLE